MSEKLTLKSARLAAGAKARPGVEEKMNAGARAKQRVIRIDGPRAQRCLKRRPRLPRLCDPDGGAMRSEKLSYE